MTPTPTTAAERAKERIEALIAQKETVRLRRTTIGLGADALFHQSIALRSALAILEEEISHERV